MAFGGAGGAFKLPGAGGGLPFGAAAGGTGGSFATFEGANIPAALATGGFSLGGDGQAKAAPAAGGFNLGGAGQAKAAAPAAGGGFKLGATAAAPAAGGGFNLGGAGQTKVAGAPAAGKASGPDITYHQLNESVTKWQGQLKSKRKEFKELGDKVTEYDRATGENWNQIKKLDSEVNAIKLTQAKLTTTLEGVESRQSQIREQLQAFDIGEQDFHDTGNTDGEKIFESANVINNNLDTTCSELQRLIHEINATSSATHEKDDAIQQITQLLQEHVTALQDVERATETLEQRIQESKDHMGEGLYQSGYGF